jgi:transcriptional regulator with PAS, ATPase and Fis domain
VRRLGSTQSEPVDVSVISATSENLPDAAQLPADRRDVAEARARAR